MLRRIVMFGCWAGLSVSLAAEPPTAETHWAYRPPVRPEVPHVRDAAVGSPVDAFIRRSLQNEGLTFSPPADPLVLLRRLTFDLIGLPPTPDELTAFQQDRSPDAIERLIDRLQASPRFGERAAVEWLDLAHYADTHGYHFDAARDMWRWRDWVIDALNAGMPFDRFTIEQLAGDLLPEAAIEQRIATGFLRNHMINAEDGAIDEEYRTEYVADRVSTVGSVWLGQTVACARCHDHKYDPLTQRDFYRLFAFFNQVPERGVGVKVGNAAPFVAAPTKLQSAEYQRLANELGRRRGQLRDREEQAADEFLRWEADARGKLDLREPPQDAIVALAFEEADGDEALNRGANGVHGLIKGNIERLPGPQRRCLLLDGKTRVELTFEDEAAASAAPGWSAAAWIFPTTNDRMTIIGRTDASAADRGWELGLERGHIVFRVTHTAETEELVVRSGQPLPERRWRQVTVVYDGGGKAAGVKLYVNGTQVPTTTVRDTLRGEFVAAQPLRIGGGERDRGFRGLLDEVRLFPRPLSAAETSILSAGDPAADLLRVKPAERTAAQRAALREFFFENIDPTARRLRMELTSLQQRFDAHRREMPTVMVMEELAQPRPTYLLERGLYDQRREQLSAGTPAFLPPLKTRGRPTRLELARWLVDPQHPLTARVAVNREWQRVWEFGLVRTPEDWGTRGELPTHPELLDWLAREFADGGWDTKRLQRVIVSSAAYRQSSRPTAELWDRDPENRLLARGPRGRLSAEMLRDAALAAGDLLTAQVGGPSVFPYQPKDIWKALAFKAEDSKDLTAQMFRPSRGADLYRRSLYTFWKRVSPPANLCLFDAPDRETTVFARGRSNTPLQALVLQNDPTFVEAARHTAERVLRGPAATPEERLTRLFLLVVTRPPQPAETHRLLALQQALQREFSAAPATARAYLAVGESSADPQLPPAETAAWTSIVLTVLNLDDAITKR